MRKQNRKKNIWFSISNLIAINAKKKRVVEAIELLSPRVNAVRCVASVRRGEQRFAEPTWVAGVVRFGFIILLIVAAFGLSVKAEESWLWPVEDTNPVISVVNQGGYGYRGAVPGARAASTYHWAVDISDTISGQSIKGLPIRAAKSGVCEVVQEKSAGGYGIYVDMKHEDGYYSRYAHMSKTTVELGEHVKQGDVIGYVGITGTASGYHLHFAIATEPDWGNGRANESGKTIDPCSLAYIYMDKDGQLIQMDLEQKVKPAVPEKKDPLDDKPQTGDTTDIENTAHQDETTDPKKNTVHQNETTKQETEAPHFEQYRVMCDKLNLRDGKGTENIILKTIPGGTELEISTVEDGWGVTSYKNITGWISMDFVLLSSLADLQSNTDDADLLQIELCGQLLISGEENEPVIEGMKLDWTAFQDVKRYNIFWADSQGKYGKPLTETPVEGTSFVDLKHINMDTNYYTVCPVFEDESEGPSGFDARTYNKGQVRSNELMLTNKSGRSKAKIKPTNFLLLKINSPQMQIDELMREIDPGRDTTPIIYEERTLAPIRTIIEAFGGTLNWDGDAQKITMSVNDVTVEMWINRTAYLVNGRNKKMDTAPLILNERTMVPLRFVAESFQCRITWIAATQEILITR